MKGSWVLVLLVLLPAVLAVSSLYDLNNDKEVNLLDLILTAKAIGSQDLIADFKADGEINIFDLILLVKNFGDVDETLPPVTPPVVSPTGWTTYQSGPHATVPPLPLPSGPKYYISPSGSDSNSGTSTGSPWKTFAYAIPKLNPGDTLVLLDGQYTVSDNGQLKMDCSGDAKNGQTGKPITIQALNERRAFIKSDGGVAVSIQNCNYIDVIGLHAENSHNQNYGWGSVVVVDNSFHINLKRLLTAHTNAYFNGGAILIVASQHILLEEIENYYYHRHGITLARSKDITIRRYFARDRLQTFFDGWYDPNLGRGGDEGIARYPASYTTIENSIIEGVTKEEIANHPMHKYAPEYSGSRGYEIHAGPNPIFDGSPGGHNNKVLGSIDIHTTNFEDSRPVNNDPNLGIRPSHGNILENMLIILEERGTGLFLRSAGGKTGTGGSLMNKVTIIGANQGIVADNYGGGLTDCTHLPTGYECAYTIRNSLFIELNDRVATATGNYQVLIENNNIFNAKKEHYEDKLPGDNTGQLQRNINVAPTNLPPIPYYIPDNSNMKGAGKNGEDIGANILYRYHNGVLTSEPLWDPATGRFPCGAIVEGLNDMPGESCYDVNKRLQVNPQTLPPNYG